ncbi:MAG: hypothetical protein U0132_02050 [Gemmatimonadaceae bacterium]
MSKLTKAEVERMVRAFWKQQEEPKAVQKPLQSTRALEKLGTDWLKSSGFDMNKAKALRAQRNAEWERMTPKASADAAKRWSAHVKQQHAAAAAWATNVAAPPVAGPSGDSFFLAKPISILASDQSMLKQINIEPENSFAKAVVDRKSGNVDTFSFIFGFRNGATTPFLFDFDTLLNISGNLRMNAGAALIGNGGVVVVDAKLDVLTATQATDTQNVAFLRVLSDGPPFFGGETGEKTFALTRFLTAPGIFLDADDIVVLIVSMVVSSGLDGTHLVADFNTGNFRALCPAVLIARRAPPMKISGIEPIVGMF